MNSRAKRLKESAKARQATYSHELKRKRVVNLLGYGSIVLGGVFLLMFLAGGQFSKVLQLFGVQGIDNQGSGLWVDCSLPENRRETYCLKSESEADQQWRAVKKRGTKKSAPFGLR